MKTAWTLGIISGLVLISCKPKRTAENDPVLKFQAEHLESLRNQLKRHEESIQRSQQADATLVDLRQKLLEARKEMITWREKRNWQEQEIKRIQTLRRKYEEQARQSARETAIGRYYPLFELPIGRSYRDVTVRKITDVGFEVSHEGGRARIAFADMSRAMKNEFLYQEDKAREILEQEAKEEMRRRIQIDAHLLTVEGNSLEQKTRAKKKVDQTKISPPTKSR